MEGSTLTSLSPGLEILCATFTSLEFDSHTAYRCAGEAINIVDGDEAIQTGEHGDID